jgi:hypothetical protein
MDAHNPSLDFHEVDDDIPPYGDPLIQVVNELPKLKRLDLGHGNQELNRIFHNYCVSLGAVEVIECLLEEQGGVVRAHEHRMPEDWTSREDRPEVPV